MKNQDKLIKSAFYEGGKKAMDEFIQKHLTYPQDAIEHKTEGKVHLFLDIDKNGKVSKAKLISGIGHGCDEEAIRVVKLMHWQVDKVRNMHVVFHQRLTINFKLPTPTAAPAAEIILPAVSNSQDTPPFQYTIVTTPTVPSEVKKETTPTPPQIVYSYTIN
jgi:TonB family protein